MKTIGIRILNKEYQMSCPPGQEEQLYLASRYLDLKMREIRSHGRVIGFERMAIMAALNIAHELLQFREQKEAYVTSVTEQIERLQNKIDEVLMEGTTSYKEVDEI